MEVNLCISFFINTLPSKPQTALNFFNPHTSNVTLPIPFHTPLFKQRYLICYGGQIHNGKVDPSPL